MALFLVGGETEVDPTDLRQIDLDQNWGQGNPPIWVAFSYWTVTADLAAGGFSMAINYLDPTGTLRTINGPTLNLTDNTSFADIPVAMATKGNARDRFTLDWSSPLPGTAKIGWKIMLTGNLDECTGTISF